MNFEKQIQEWVTFDNEIKTLNNRVKILREKKNQLEEQLFDNFDLSNSKDFSIHISDGLLKFTNTKITNPLTFKYIEQTLGEIIKNKEQLTIILSYLKTKRETKIVPEIKRIILKTRES
jgi:hypothetical protein